VKQRDAVQMAYDTLLNVYNYSAIPDVTKKLVIGPALEKIAAAFPNDPTPYRGR
jgi:hypothetical protein